MMNREFLNHAERDRLCNLLAEKRDELIMRLPGTWMYRHVMAEIIEIRGWLRVDSSKVLNSSVRVLVKR